MSHPDGLPDLFLDRSLGRKKVPGLLRAGGLRLVTLAEHYGIPAAEMVSDEAWLELVGTRGWVALMRMTALDASPAEICRTGRGPFLFAIHARRVVEVSLT